MQSFRPVWKPVSNAGVPPAILLVLAVPETAGETPAVRGMPSKIIFMQKL